MTDESAPPIDIRGLTKTYRLGFAFNKQVKALRGIDLTVRRGEVFGILGPNGAGKSTTLKILMNLVRATSGEARIFGLPPESPLARRRVGFLPENPAPYEYLTGREFVRLAGRLTGRRGPGLRAKVDEVLGLVEMTRAADLQIRRYSKGMVQRIGLAQALVNEPDLLILDEPTSGLDPIGRRQMRDLVLAQRQRGTTVIFCTHIIPDVEALCDRIAVLVGGKLVQEGSVQELVTGQVPQVEVAVEGIARNVLEQFQLPLQRLEELGNRLLVQLGDAEAQALINRVITSGGRISRVQPVSFTLEDLFMKTLEQSSGASVGGEIVG